MSLSERARYRCRVAKQLEDAGEYEAACAALDEFWPDRYEPPVLKGLDNAAKAEVLLRVGALAGWTGSASQAGGAQETAKDLISRSVEIFEELGETSRAAEARSDLAVCYWREGAIDEARIILLDVTNRVSEADQEVKAIALIRRGMVEKTATRYSDALKIYDEAASLISGSDNHALQGKLHNELGITFHSLALAESGEQKFDRALMEFTAASFHFEQAGHHRYCARVENNLGYLFFTVGRFEEAYSHLDRARRLFLDLEDMGSAAEVDETRARALLAEGLLSEAERFARSAVKTFERGGAQSLLAETLTTHGIVLARLGKHGRSKAALQRATEVAQTSGDLEGAGRAQLSIIEELGQQISLEEMVTNYRSAAEFLKRSQDPSTTARLISCAEKVIGSFALARTDIEADAIMIGNSWDGFSFKQQVLDYEKALLSRALRDTGGAVTKAARLLGFRHHQSLIALINSRHKGLLGVRSAVRTRRRSIIKTDKNGSKKQSHRAAKS
jgi:tetratricopeptide (TPR) repeat protein